MAKRNLSIAPMQSPSMALQGLTEEARDSLSHRIAEHAAMHRAAIDRVPVTPDRVVHGVALALDILIQRADPDPETYMRWAKDRGCKAESFRTPSFLVGPDGAPILDIYDRAYQWTFGKPLPSDLTPERFVVEMLRATQTMSGGRAWVREILIDERAWFVEISVADRRSDGFEYTLLDRSALGTAFWYGSIGARREHLLLCGPTLHEIIARDGRVAVMQVMLAGVSSNNKPVPITIELYHDPHTNRWLAHAITLSNMHEIFPYTAF